MKWLFWILFLGLYFVAGPIAQAWLRRREGGKVVRVLAAMAPDFYKAWRHVFPPPPPPMPEEGPYRTSGKVIENADVHPGATIAGTKIAPDDEGAKGQGEVKPFVTIPRKTITFPTPPNQGPTRIVPGAVYKLYPPRKDDQ